jgi:hypothetical protein
MPLRDILLTQLNFVEESPTTTLLWYKPPFLTPSAAEVMETPRDMHIAEEVAYYL